ATTMLLFSQPGLTQLVNGQLTLFVIALAFVDASGAFPRRWQGSLVGLAAALKLTPLIFLPYYAITKQWRQLVVASASFGVFTAIGFDLFPADSLYFWTHANSSARLGPENPENLSIYGALNRWLTDPTAVQMVWL
ncbi:glycosyltransferase family 87 protein, partial [Staphylococcus aureus]|uniref:glycosyltransferase family 87 protein n=1 Tax=Staphylococcus aureus TaxID=1280 RepID=UPI003D1EDCDA